MKLDGALTLGNTSIVLHKKQEDKQTPKKTISDTYSEFAKLVFLFDTSSSMENHIARTASGKSLADLLYVFTPDILADIRLRVETALAEYNTVQDAGGEISEDVTKLACLADAWHGANGELVFSASDDELKDRILRTNLTDFFNILPTQVTNRDTKAPTRMSVVKRLAKQEIVKRFQKFPKSRIAVIAFNDHPTVLFDDGASGELDAEVEKLHASGGTNILEAIKQGMEVCRAKPSSVGIHHFLLVTDGEDPAADVIIRSWVPTLKASGVILDYIHIGDSYVNQGLRDACAELGGEYVPVNSEDELEEKFMQALKRPLLPPATASV